MSSPEDAPLNEQPEQPSPAASEPDISPETAPPLPEEVVEEAGEQAVETTVETPPEVRDILDGGAGTDEKPLRMGVWRSHGPRGTDNPLAEIIDEVDHTDGKKYYKMRDPEDHGHTWFVPAEDRKSVV